MAKAIMNVADQYPVVVDFSPKVIAWAGLIFTAGQMYTSKFVAIYIRETAEADAAARKEFEAKVVPSTTPER